MLATFRKTLRRAFETEITAIAQALVDNWHARGRARMGERVVR